MHKRKKRMDDGRLLEIYVFNAYSFIDQISDSLGNMKVGHRNLAFG